MGQDPLVRYTIATARRSAGRSQQSLGCEEPTHLRANGRKVDDLWQNLQVGGNPMQDGLSAPVIGPSAILPRGFLWQTPIWYLLIAGVLAVSRWPPIWFRLTVGVGLTVAMIVFLLAVNAITTHSFAANQDGVFLGLPPRTRRRGRRRRDVKHLPWQQIEKVRLAPRPYGTRVELLLGPSASLALRGFKHNPLRRMLRWFLLMIPFWYMLRPTALTSPLDGPPRYRVNLRDVTVDELRLRFRAVAPPEVAIAVLVRKR